MSEWDRIVREHGPMVFGTAWRILGHAADTEDVVQDVFLEAHQRSQNQPVRHWAGFLRCLASCRALDRLRVRKNLHSLNGMALLDSADGPEEIAREHELVARLRKAVSKLPEREGAVFCLRFFEDLPYEEIAEALNITRGAVAQALHKARAKLEVLLAETAKRD